MRHATALAFALFVALLGGCRTRCGAPPAVERVGSSQDRTPLVYSEMEVVHADASALQAFADAGVAGGSRVLSAAEAVSLRASLAAAKAPMLNAPRLLTMQGQEGTVFVAEEPKGHPENWTGFHAALRAQPAASGAGLDLDVSVVHRPAGQPPSAEERAEAKGARLADGQTLLLVAPARADSTTHLVVLLTARLVPPQD